MIDKVITETERICNEIMEEGISTDNVHYLGDLIDIHKDLKNEKYWEEKIDTMRRKYGMYDRDYDNMYYNARNRDTRGRYKGDRMIDSLYDTYGRYSEMKETHNTSTKPLEYMLDSLEDFVCMLMEDANSQEEVDLIKQTTRHISDM